MGWGTKWLKNLLSGKKNSKDQKDTPISRIGEWSDKKRWSFGKPRQTSATSLVAQSPGLLLDNARLGSSHDEAPDRSRQATPMAMASGTAFAARKAGQKVMVRLKSIQRHGAAFDGSYEWWAAVKIQTAFRGFLARKALRALKGLVKLQALVRGYVVRKQTAAALQRLQALVRAQTAMKRRKSHNFLTGGRRFHPEFIPRRSFELRSNSSEARSRSTIASAQSSDGFDRSPKIVEMDTCLQRSRSFRRTSSFHPAEDSPKLSTAFPVPHKFPSLLSIPGNGTPQRYDWRMEAENYYQSKTAQSTPRLTSTTFLAKPLACSDRVLCQTPERQNYPNYMANTRSFVAKVRSQSAPKQRMEMGKLRKKVSKNEAQESRGNMNNGAGAKSSCYQVQAAYNLKSIVVGKLDRPAELSNEASRYYYLDNAW